MKSKLHILVLLILLPTGASGQDFYRFTPLSSVSTRNHQEMLPVIYRNGIVYLDNRPSSSLVEYTEKNSDQPFTDLYFVERKERNRWGNAEVFAKELNTNFFDGPVSFANDYRLICFSRMYLENGGRNSNGNTGIFFADYENEAWVNIREFEYNDPEVSLYAPFITPDGRELYFVADLEDSRGGLDIYVSRFARGQWSEPENLGDNINSAAHERHPFKHPIGRLYFSRKPVDGSEDGDLFYSNMVDGTWTPSVPMSSDYNKVTDELGIYIDEHFSEGFITRRQGATYDIQWFYTDYPVFEVPRRIQHTPMKYRLRENSLDTIDYTIFDYKWIINDTLSIPGHDIVFEFPGPGDYHLRFDVYNKVTDTLETGVAEYDLPLRPIEQPDFSHRVSNRPAEADPDTVFVGQEILFDAAPTYLPNFNVDNYFWDFGDGSKSDGPTATHVYTYPGTFRIVLGVREAVENNDYEPELKASFKQIIVEQSP